MNKDEICLCIFLVIGAIVVFFIYRQKVSGEETIEDVIPSKHVTFSEKPVVINNKPKIIEKRLKAYDDDIFHWSDYDYIIINDNLDNCFIQIEKIIIEAKNN